MVVRLQPLFYISGAFFPIIPGMIILSDSMTSLCHLFPPYSNLSILTCLLAFATFDPYLFQHLLNALHMPHNMLSVLYAFSPSGLKKTALSRQDYWKCHSIGIKTEGHKNKVFYFKFAKVISEKASIKPRKPIPECALKTFLSSSLALTTKLS